jgi:hypothetical protein
MTPPCRGQHALFDSTDVSDHYKARDICAACPLIDACRAEVTALIANAGYYGHPEGTWAGDLYHSGKLAHSAIRAHAKRARAERIMREDAMYSDDDARDAHAAYTRGERGRWARVGHKVYQRRAKRRQRVELEAAS